MKFEVENGAFWYDKKTPVLSDINFSFETPEIVSVLGPNGVGKTTLLRCALGLLSWKEGSTMLDGKNIKSIKQKERWQSISYVPQAKVNSFSYTVEEMVLLGRSAHLGELSHPGKVDLEIATEAMDIVKITHLRKKLCNEISGGEYQMALIARALATKPSLIVLDEPESNLDFKNQLLVQNTIRDLCQSQKIGTLVNTHFPHHALEISDKSLLLMNDGTSIFGKTEEVLSETNLGMAFDVDISIQKFEMMNKTHYCVLSA
ncbi:MAG: ABC transporter ATP-binding protein [Oscillospiraceae bacterium]